MAINTGQLLGTGAEFLTNFFASNRQEDANSDAVSAAQSSPVVEELRNLRGLVGTNAASSFNDIQNFNLGDRTEEIKQDLFNIARPGLENNAAQTLSRDFQGGTLGLDIGGRGSPMQQAFSKNLGTEISRANILGSQQGLNESQILNNLFLNDIQSIRQLAETDLGFEAGILDAALKGNQGERDIFSGLGEGANDILKNLFGNSTFGDGTSVLDSIQNLLSSGGGAGQTVASALGATGPGAVGLGAGAAGPAGVAADAALASGAATSAGSATGSIPNIPGLSAIKNFFSPAAATGTAGSGVGFASAAGGLGEFGGLGAGGAATGAGSAAGAGGLFGLSPAATGFGAAGLVGLASLLDNSVGVPNPAAGGKGGAVGQPLPGNRFGDPAKSIRVRVVGGVAQNWGTEGIGDKEEGPGKWVTIKNPKIGENEGGYYIPTTFLQNLEKFGYPDLEALSKMPGNPILTDPNRFGDGEGGLSPQVTPTVPTPADQFDPVVQGDPWWKNLTQKQRFDFDREMSSGGG